MIIALIQKSKIELRSTGFDDNWTDGDDTAKKLVTSKTTLVVCPPSCLMQWQQEIETKARGLKVAVFHGPGRTSSAAVLAQSDVVLTTFPLVGSELTNMNNTKKPKSPLFRINFWRIVLDEAHNIRNPKTKAAQAICQLHARHRWAVTGTPVHNIPEDIFSIVKFLKMAPYDDRKVRIFSFRFITYFFKIFF